MIINDEMTAACVGTADRGHIQHPDGGLPITKASGPFTGDRGGWTKTFAPIGCGYTLPRWMFSDELGDTICDMCKWRLGRERRRIVGHYPRLREAYPYENSYQRKIQQEAAADWAAMREAYIEAGVRILLRGDKVTLERLAAETGSNSKSRAYTYFKEGPPSKVIKRLADQRLKEASDA